MPKPSVRSTNTTSWELIDGAAKGGEQHIEEFARRYGGLVRECLAARLRGSPLLADLDDAVQEVFVECFRAGGALERADPRRPAGFRPFLGGVIRNVARRMEDAHSSRRETQMDSELRATVPADREDSISRILDKGWARMILGGAGERHRQRAAASGGEAPRRIELLRLRFEKGMPVREIARLWNTTPRRLHGEYRQARREFRACLEAEIEAHAGGTDEVRRLWKELLSVV